MPCLIILLKQNLVLAFLQPSVPSWFRCQLKAFIGELFVVRLLQACFFLNSVGSFKVKVLATLGKAGMLNFNMSVIKMKAKCFQGSSNVNSNPFKRFVVF